MTIFNSGKVNIICAEDCGNAPKKILIRDFITALAISDQEFISNHITDHFRWEKVGVKQILGKLDYLQSLSATDISEVLIKNIITHGNTGAANGTIILGSTSIAFCNVYLFTSSKNAKIKEITSYEIQI